MKKIIPMILTFCMLIASSTIIVNAECLEKSNNIAEVDINSLTNSSNDLIFNSETKNELGETSNLDKISSLSIENNTDKLTEYDAILIKQDNIESINISKTLELIDNGTNIVVYTDNNNLNISKVISIFGDGMSSLTKDTKQEISAVIISSSNMGKLNYSFICNIYPTEEEKYDISTGEKTIVPITYQQKPKFNKEKFVDGVYNFINENEKLKIKFKGVNNTNPINDNAYIQIPPNEYQYYLTTRWDSYRDGTLVAQTYSPIYLYDQGRPQSNTSLREWTMFSYNTSSAFNNNMMDWMEISVNGRYYNQQYKYHTQLPSNSSINVGGNLGASLDSEGLQVGLGYNESYSIQTNGLTIDNYPDVELVKCRWKATTDAFSRFNSLFSSIPYNNSMQVEAYLTVRGNNNDGYVKGSRKFDLYTLEVNGHLYYWRSHYYVSDEEFSASYSVYK